MGGFRNSSDPKWTHVRFPPNSVDVLSEGGKKNKNKKKQIRFPKRSSWTKNVEKKGAQDGGK